MRLCSCLLLKVLSFTFPFPLWLLSCSVVPQTTVILNNDRQNSIVAKMVGQEEPLSRAADSLENILSKLVAVVGILPLLFLLWQISSGLQQFPVKVRNVLGGGGKGKITASAKWIHQSCLEKACNWRYRALLCCWCAEDILEDLGWAQCWLRDDNWKSSHSYVFFLTWIHNCLGTCQYPVFNQLNKEYTAAQQGC